MKKSIYYVFLILMCAHIQGRSQCSSNWDLNPSKINWKVENNPAYKPGWHLLHADEFKDNKELDPEFWLNRTGVMDQNKTTFECYYFVKSENVSYSNDRCQLKCVPTLPFGTKVTHYDPWYLANDPVRQHLFAETYSTGSWITTKYEYGPGMFAEIKCKRNNYGYKSSFWSYEYEDINHYGEGISIFDNNFSNHDHLRENFYEFFDYDYADPQVDGKDGKIFLDPQSPSFFEEDYIYSVDWKTDNIKLYIDNKLVVNESTVVPVTEHQFELRETSNYWESFYGTTGHPDHYWEESATTPYDGADFDIDYIRFYKPNSTVSMKIEDFGQTKNWLSQNENPRFFADINADGKKDIVGFGAHNVEVSLSDISNKEISFLNYQIAISNFSLLQGWSSQENMPRFLADINNDGMADIVGFGFSDVYAALSNSNSSTASFPGIEVARYNEFTISQNWSGQTLTPRFMADINLDGKEDIVGFGPEKVEVSYSTSVNSVVFTQPEIVLSEFTIAQGWDDQNTYPRMLGDIDGDGRKDIVGFGYDLVYVSFGQNNFSTPFTTPVSVIQDFTVSQGWSGQDERPRYLADVNGDGKDDIIGFGVTGVYISLSNCYPGNIEFLPPVWVAENFTVEQGFLNVNTFPRFVCDINNDKMADIIGINNTNVQISISKGGRDHNELEFYKFQNSIDNFTPCHGWETNNSYPRFITDVNGDGSLDFMGFGYDGVRSYESIGGTYNVPSNSDLTIKGSNQNKSNDWDLASFDDGPDVAYKLFVPVKSNLSITLIPDPGFNSLFQLFSENFQPIGAVQSGGTTINANGIGVELSDNQYGTYVYVVVDGDLQDVGEFILKINGTRANGNPLPWRNESKSNSTNLDKVSKEISIYPNPAANLLNVEFSPEVKNIEITDISGKRIETIFINNDVKKLDINIEDLKESLYLITFRGSDIGSITKKFTVIK